MKKFFDLLCFAQQRWLKTIRIMKLTAGLILFTIISATAANSYSQTARINLNVKNATIVDIFREIERNSEFGFFFKSEEMNLEKRQSLNMADATIDQVLSKVLDDNYSYKILDKNIVVTKGTFEAVQQQSNKVTGKVTDKTGVSLPGVSVVVKGTTTGMVTDGNGKFSLTIPESATFLTFSFVGMQSQDVAIAGKTEFNVVLLDETVNIEEVVAIGYGTSKKKDLTGSVSNISAEKLLDRPAFNVAQAIGGKVAGIKIIERNGAPGGNAMIRVRGTNSINSNNDPLFVVDGVVGVSNALGILNPNEIESMDVLKDASATAIYGARGANGVILITTKRGVAGKTQVEYNGYVTRGEMNRKFYVLDAEQMMYVTKQAWMNVNKYASSPNWPAAFDASVLPSGYTGNTYSEMPWLFEKTTQGGYSIPLMGKDGNYYKPRFNTNWESEIFKPSTSTNHQINIRGGNENAKFGAFMNYALEDGLLLNSSFRRYSGKLTGDIKVSDKVSFSANLGINKNRNRTNDVSYFSGGIARAAVEAYSILPIKYPNDPALYGSYAGQWSSNADFPAGETPHNPVHISNDVETYDDRSQVTGDVTLNVKFTPELSFKSNFAVDLNFYKHNNYGGRLITTNGNADINTNNSTYWQNEDYFNYNKTFGDHTVTGMLGLSWSRYDEQRLSASNSFFFDDFYKWHNLGLGTVARPGVGSGDGQNSLNSYFARANYNYKSKYFVTITGREDGSSRFGVNSKYGFFPSGSLAWRVSEEEFLKK
ncbi:MAG TPA: SusC/RagA family TonB-linked outer membrane protein, partial [Prolixibacteraceae bacterium]